MAFEPPATLSALPPPFIPISGVLNFRDLGGLPSTAHPGFRTKDNLIFRSASLASITPEGIKQLQDLGVTTVFDLRAHVELAIGGEPLSLALQKAVEAQNTEGERSTYAQNGVEPLRIRIVRAPVIKDVGYGPEVLVLAYQRHAGGQGFIARYTEMLEEGGPAFGTIFKHLRDSPDEPCLIHCTGGKDRTGLAAALILSVAGVDDDRIAKEYALTSVGLASAIPAQIEKLKQNPALGANPEVALRMLSSTYETMSETLALFRDRYGGAEGYLKSHAELSDEDLDIIRKRILVPVEE